LLVVLIRWCTQFSFLFFPQFEESARRRIVALNFLVWFAAGGIRVNRQTVETDRSRKRIILLREWRWVERPRVWWRRYLERPIADLADVMNKVKPAKVVMLGEASHAWHAWVLPLASFHLTGVGGKTRIQFHRCVEGDNSPSSQRVNRFINLEEDEIWWDRDRRGVNLKGPALRRRVCEILRSFKRWPTWIWTNLEVEQLVEWVRTWNSKVGQAERRVGFYGLDVY
jgi:hypothetical protein